MKIQQDIMTGDKNKLMFNVDTFVTNYRLLIQENIFNIR